MFRLEGSLSSVNETVASLGKDNEGHDTCAKTFDLSYVNSKQSLDRVRASWIRYYVLNEVW